MCTFDNLWTMLREHGSGPAREIECRQLWDSYSPEQQRFLCNTIRAKLDNGRFVHYDPLRAMNENARLMHRNVLSFNAYYARNRTTEERDGWTMRNPTGNRVIYVRT